MRMGDFMAAFAIMLNRKDVTLEEARLVGQVNKEGRALVRGQLDSLITHLPTIRRVEKEVNKKRIPCLGTCRKMTTRRFMLWPFEGPLCKLCERADPKYETIAFTEARRRFFLSTDDLENVPSIKRALPGGFCCRFLRPQDLLSVAHLVYTNVDAFEARRAKGLKRRAAALRGIAARNARREASV
jgi:hypothetical protein